MTALPDYPEWRNFTPFYRQADVDDAIMLFWEIESSSAGDTLRQARAMAWRAYCTLVAIQEGWEIKDWGNNEDSDSDLPRTAHNLAKAAKDLMSPADFDALWAWAFAKMYFQDSNASQVMRRAIHRAEKQAEEGDSYAALSISSLLAEAADIYIYQGQIDAALAAIYEALYVEAAAENKIPDWFRWILALALFNKALLLEDSTDAADRNHAQRLYRRVKRVLSENWMRTEHHHRYEFDSLRLHAAAHWKLGDGGESEKIEKFRRKLRNRKADWTASKEKERSRYLSTGDAAVLKAKWSDIADALFPAPAAAN